MKTNNYPIIAREGWFYIAISLLFSTYLTSISFSFSIPFWIISIFIIQFFRDPKRKISSSKGVVVSGADGRVIAIDETMDPYQKKKSIKVSVFMNVFNVHSNKSPIDGKILNKIYYPGKFLNAALSKASVENERCAIIIQAENNHVLQLRKLIVMLKDIPVKKLSAKQQAWLLSVSKKYKLENQYINNNIFEELLKRVDYVPPSLALTQAAIESGWGSSRFARQGNNLFGQWCFSSGCGMVPSLRESGKGHEVAKFDTVNLAVRSYILNLNSHESYTELRENRADLRDKELSLSLIHI